jgi:hypothetical protein
MAGLFANTPPSIIPKLWPARFWIKAGGKYVGAAEVARAMSLNRKFSLGGSSPGSMLEPFAFQLLKKYGARGTNNPSPSPGC